MNGSIMITLEDGSVLRGTVLLSASAQSSLPASSVVGNASSPSPDGKLETLDFSLPIRPFMNDYAGELSGSKKFTLLVAHFAGGQLDVPVDRAGVIEAWNKMTGLLGGKFNGAHESRAKDSGFIYVPEPGRLALLKKWRQAY